MLLTLLALVSTQSVPENSFSGNGPPSSCQSKAEMSYSRLGYEVAYSIHKESHGPISFNQIVDLPASAFSSMTGYFNGGVDTTPTWLRIDPTNLPRDTEVWLEFSPQTLDFIDVYEHRSGHWIQHASGDMRAYANREVKANNHVIRLRPDVDHPVFVRIQNNGIMLVYARFWKPDMFWDAWRTVLPVKSSLLGINGVLGLLVFVLFTIFRQPILLALAFAWIFRWWFVFNLEGFGAAYLFDNSPTVASHMVNISLILLAISSMWLIQKAFPPTGRHDWPRWVIQAGIVFAFLSIASIGTPVYGKIQPIILALPLIGFGMGLILTAKHWSEGRVLTRWIGLALLLHFVITLPTLITLWFQLTPREGMHYAWHLGSIPGSVILVAAVLYEINSRFKTGRASEFAALERAEKSEANLERKVQIRTQELLESKDLIAKTLEQRTRLLDVIGHEFRTPLAALSLSVDKLSHSPPLDQSELDERGMQLRRHLEQLNQLVTSCLSDERLRTNSNPTQPKSVAIRPWLTTIAAHFPEVNIQFKGVSITDTRTFDPEMLAIAMTNLLDNARKYAPESRLEIHCHAEDTAWVIEVCDHGPGICDENKVRLFERFVRCGTSRQIRGLGLGLHISRHIVELNQGTLTLQDTPGGGCTFVIRMGVPPIRTHP